MKDAVSANRDYLAQIIGQYRIGKRDNMAYRVARRNAHNNDAQLTTRSVTCSPNRDVTALQLTKVFASCA